MDMKNLTIKQLYKEDTQDYINLFEKFTKMMYMPKDQICPLEHLLYVYNNPDAVTYGAFLDKKLIGALSGRYIQNSVFWYSFNLMIDISSEVNTLNLHSCSALVSMELFDMLIEKGEKLQRFIFYDRKNLKHQLAVERSVNRLRGNPDIKPYKIFNYFHMFEKIYPAGYVCMSRNDVPLNHRFFLQPNTVYTEDTVIVCHSLKPTERKKLLGLPLI